MNIKGSQVARWGQQVRSLYAISRCKSSNSALSNCVMLLIHAFMLLIHASMNMLDHAIRYLYMVLPKPLSATIAADGFHGLIDDMLDSHNNSEVAFSDMGGSAHGTGSLGSESSNESVVNERHRARSDGSGSPAALLRPLSRAGCRSPERQAVGKLKAAGAGKGKVVRVGADENSPLMGNVGQDGIAASGKRRSITVPRLVLGEARSD